MAAGNMNLGAQVARPPTTEELVLGQRNSLVVQVLDLQAAAVVLENELKAARARIAQLEAAAAG